VPSGRALPGLQHTTVKRKGEDPATPGPLIYGMTWDRNYSPRTGEGGAASWGGGAVDDGYVNVFLAAALTRVMCAAVPIPAVAAASVLYSAAVGGSVAGDVEPL